MEDADDEVDKGLVEAGREGKVERVFPLVGVVIVAGEGDGEAEGD